MCVGAQQLCRLRIPAGSQGSQCRRPLSRDSAAAVVEDIPLLSITPEAEQLAEFLVQRAALPAKAAADGLHIATAAYHRVNSLLTWNCAHIANAIKRPMIERICRECGCEPPVLCTPDEPIGGKLDVE